MPSFKSILPVSLYKIWYLKSGAVVYMVADPQPTDDTFSGGTYFTKDASGHFSKATTFAGTDTPIYWVEA